MYMDYTFLYVEMLPFLRLLAENLHATLLGRTTTFMVLVLPIMWISLQLIQILCVHTQICLK